MDYAGPRTPRRVRKAPEARSRSHRRGLDKGSRSSQGHHAPRPRSRLRLAKETHRAREFVAAGLSRCAGLDVVKTKASARRFFVVILRADSSVPNVPTDRRL